MTVLRKGFGDAAGDSSGVNIGLEVVNVRVATLTPQDGVQVGGGKRINGGRQITPYSVREVSSYAREPLNRSAENKAFVFLRAPRGSIPSSTARKRKSNSKHDLVYSPGNNGDDGAHFKCSSVEQVPLDGVRQLGYSQMHQNPVAYGSQKKIWIRRTMF